MRAAWAHGTGLPHGPQDAAFGWSLEPWVVGPIVVAALLYGVGSVRLRRRGQRAGLAADALFWCGLLVLALALTSPLHAVGTRVFSAHMIEHELLMVVAVPLMVAARPGARLLWGLPQGWRRDVAGLLRDSRFVAAWRGLTELWSATLLHAAVLWLWHEPRLFQATLTSEAVHVAQHLSFVLSAILFWVAVLRCDARRSGQGAAVVALFLTSMQAGLLGALLTFSRALWYPAALDPFPICGLTRGEDQAMAGLIMWIPACTLYVAAALVLMARWLGRLEARHV